MGSSSSKAAKTAAGAASRRYPTRIPPNTPSPSPTPLTSPSAQTARTNNSNTTTPTSASHPTTPGPTVHPQAHARSTKDDSIRRDAADPDFAASLRQLGPVMPSSTMSNSSTFAAATAVPSPSAAAGGSNRSDPAGYSGSVFPDPRENPALLVLQARERIAAEAEREFGVARTGVGAERRFVDVGVIRDVLALRDGKGLGAGEIEEKLGLRKGVVAMLSRVGEARVGKVDGSDAGLY